jgi:membrane fusion protein (multidrug efflux system)
MTDSDAPPPASRRPFIILGLVLAVIAAAGLVYYLVNRGDATTEDAQIDGNIYQIAPRVAGQVAQVLVDDNQHVSRGQLLVLLDPGDQQVALEKAQATAAQAQANLGEAEANESQAVANVAVADASLLQATQDFERYKAIDPNATSRQQVDAAAATLRGAQARRDAAVQQVAGMRAGIVSAQAAYHADLVAVQDARLQLSYTRIAAPAAGYVSQRTVRAGAVVAAGTPLLAVVGDDVWVTANYKETQLAEIQPGAAASVTVDAVPDVVFKMHVASIDRGTGTVFSLLPAQNATGNYVKIIQRVPVKLTFDDPAQAAKYLLSLGMSVEPSVRISK